MALVVTLWHDVQVPICPSGCDCWCFCGRNCPDRCLLLLVQPCWCQRLRFQRVCHDSDSFPHPGSVPGISSPTGDTFCCSLAEWSMRFRSLRYMLHLCRSFFAQVLYASSACYPGQSQLHVCIELLTGTLCLHTRSACDLMLLCLPAVAGLTTQSPESLSMFTHLVRLLCCVAGPEWQSVPFCCCHIVLQLPLLQCTAK